MRAITRVPEPPVAPMTNGAKLATPTLATAKAGEQYPALPQFQHVDEEQPRNCLSCLGRTVDRSRRELHPRKSAPAVSDILDDHAATDVSALPKGIEVIRRDCQLSGKAKKTEFFTCLPQQIETAAAPAIERVYLEKPRSIGAGRTSASSSTS
jgi:hypothetical protein